MNIQDIISSGILESFVLGETTEQETANILNLAEQHPEIREEIDRIEQTIQQTALLGAVAPPAHARQRFLESIAEGQSSMVENAQSEPQLQVSHRNQFNKLAAAIAALLTVSLAVNYWLYSKWKADEKAVADLMAEKQILAANDKKQEASLKLFSEKLALLQNPDITAVVMKGTDKAPAALATVYWNKKSGETYLDLQSLPEAPTGKQYQLWAIVDGKPMDAGVFNASIAGRTVLKMKSHLKPVLFAVTVESEGGSATPTLETMVLSGSNS